METKSTKSTELEYSGYFIDVETGGLDPKIHALTSICIGRFTLYPDPEREPRMSLVTSHVTPAGDLLVTEAAAKVRGKTRGELYTGGADEAYTADRLHQWLEHNGGTYLPIWAHNANFDRDFLSAMVKRNELWTLHNLRLLSGRDSRWNCTRYLAEYLVQKGKLKMPCKPDGTPSVSLDPLLERLGIPGRQSEHHGASEDVVLGILVLDKLLRLDGWWDKPEGPKWWDGVEAAA